MKKILLLGGSAQQIVAIETAKKFGYYTVLCDFLPDNPGQYAADKFYQVSTTDKQAILEVAQKEGIDGILAYASDPAAPTAAYVAQMMGLPGNPYESVEILCNKDRFRAFLAENDFCTPKAKGYTDTETAYADLATGAFRLPVIVKPVDSSGSKGVTVLRCKDDAKEALEFAFSFSRCHRVIVEDYIEKRHLYLIGGDVFIIDGEIVLWGLMNCHRDARVNPLVPVGKSYPLELEAADEENVKNTLRRMVKILGLRNGAMNVELVVDVSGRVWPIDVGPRSGGNMIPDLLGDMFCADIAKMSVQAAMGEPIDGEFTAPQACYATHNLHSDRNGIYETIDFSPELDTHIYRKCLYKQSGEQVEYFDNSAKCLGIIFMKFEDREEMRTILGSITDRITIRLTEK